MKAKYATEDGAVVLLLILLPTGVTQRTWSGEASMLFKKHVEGRALVAQVVSWPDESEVIGELWEPKLTVYLVDTTLDDRDLWIHSIMADICV